MTPEEYLAAQRRGNVCATGVHAIGYPAAAVCPFCGQRVAWIDDELKRLIQREAQAPPRKA